jgi:hypothetical protein
MEEYIGIDVGAKSVACARRGGRTLFQKIPFKIKML